MSQNRIELSCYGNRARFMQVLINETYEAIRFVVLYLIILELIIVNIFKISSN